MSDADYWQQQFKEQRLEVDRLKDRLKDIYHTSNEAQVRKMAWDAMFPPEQQP